jgi:FMN phosphatase YigB (HAD superfamily)
MTTAAPLPPKPKLITFDTDGTLIDRDTALRLLDLRDVPGILGFTNAARKAPHGV